MNLREAEQLAKELFKKHSVAKKWKFKFDKATRRFGLTSYRNNTISLSKILTKLNSKEVVKGILLHEIAHTLVKRNHHHDKVWKKKAVEIGCSPARCYGSEVITPPRPKFKGFYTATCPKCNKKITYDVRNSRRYACRACCKKFNDGKFTEKFLLKWELEKRI